MELQETKKVLNDFAKYVIQQARSNLTKDKKNFNKKLYNSLSFTPPLIDNTGIIIQFVMEDYGVYQDEGVKGKDPSQVSPNAKIKGQQAPNSRFRFGSGTSRGTFDKFAKRMSLFAKAKNINMDPRQAFSNDNTSGPKVRILNDDTSPTFKFKIKNK